MGVDDDIGSAVAGKVGGHCGLAGEAGRDDVPRPLVSGAEQGNGHGHA